MTVRRLLFPWVIACLAAVVTGPVALSPLAAQDTRIRGFVDVVLSASDQPGAQSAFSLGQYDLYITSKLGNGLSFLGESVFEYDNGFFVDIERIQVQVQPRSWFQAIVGKQHTPIGYWNNAYHHGALLQPTIQRPLMYRFEDEGGVLPIHTTGLRILGRDISAGHLGYEFMVGNGIGSDPTQDNDAAKSLTASVFSQITSRLMVGVSGYSDKIAAGVPNLGGTPLPQSLRQSMGGGFAIYNGTRAEGMAELMVIRNRTASGANSTTTAYYAYGGYRIDGWTPYVRFDGLAYPSADPYFVVNDIQQLVLGTRYDVTAAFGVKAEVRHFDTAVGGTYWEFATQVAVGF